MECKMNKIIIVFEDNEEAEIQVINRQSSIEDLGAFLSKATFEDEREITGIIIPTKDIPKGNRTLAATINALISGIVKAKYPTVEVEQDTWVKGGFGAKVDILEVDYWRARGFEADTYTELHKEIIEKFGKVLNLCDEMDKELKTSGLEHKGCKFGTYHYTLASALKNTDKS